jgi:hypothetical protein
MIILNNSYDGLPFDLNDLEYSAGRPIQICAFDMVANEDHKIIVSNKIKNIAPVEQNCVNLSMDKFKYQITFDDIVVYAKVNNENDTNVALASIDNLKQYLPKNVNLDINKDLMGVAFDAFVVNRANKNGHIISTDVALDMVENFINKPFNIEHNRKTIVGFCTGYGFSSFEGSEPLSLKEVKAMNTPFNVVLSGYVWKVVNPEFAEELVKSADPESSDYLSVSASWELGFNEFNIARGSNNLKDAEIIEEEKEILELKDSLKVFGGNGYDADGKSILLNLQGTVLPLGIGFTNTPAAEVKGVAISTDNKNENQDNKINKKSVQSENNDVKSNMQINKLEDITESSLKEVAANEVRDFISNKIAELSKEWKLKVDEKETALSEAQAQVETLKTDLEQIKAESDKVKTELANMIEVARAKELEAAFQSRMSLVDEQFNLTSEDREIIAEDLQSLADDEAFQKWFKKFSTFAAAKKKDGKDGDGKDGKKLSNVEKDKEDEKPTKGDDKAEKTAEKGMSASETKTVEEVVSAATHETPEIPNSSSTQELSLMEKISAAFNKNSVTIRK